MCSSEGRRADGHLNRISGCVGREADEYDSKGVDRHSGRLGVKAANSGGPGASQPVPRRPRRPHLDSGWQRQASTTLQPSVIPR